MKIQILDIDGKKIKEETTELFEEPIREDLIFKVVEAEKQRQEYAPKQYSGMNRSASGKVQHKRHSWNTDRGKGMPRIPKKTMWRRGTQFSWVGAIIPSTRGGRRAHPPKTGLSDKKINKREMKKAILSALSYVANENEVKKKYVSISDKKIDVKFPIVVEDKILKLKTKELFDKLQKILGDLYLVAIQKKTIRAGKGKMRGRKNKKNAGMLLIIGNNEKIKISGIEVLKARDVMVCDLASGGARLTIFTEHAVKDLEKLIHSEAKK